ncbi:MAG TPA: DUF924 family protein [Candidatus Binatia bacterium]|nr:DUF924 family protein [Candidatus Binatia bacterium]
MKPMRCDDILEFWFGSNPDDAAVAKEKSALWWSKKPAVDDEIRARFEALILKATTAQLADWESDPRGRLALILLTDQFPRNIYRDSPKAFAYDSKALAWCRAGIDQGLDVQLRPIERVFFYLPLEHAETLEHQNESVKHFRRLLDTVGADLKAVFTEYLDFAVRHREIIARFGRFPHRNKILGRESTAEELAFLNQPGSSF